MNKNIDNSKPFYIWEGVYPNFEEALSKSKGSGFSGEIYLDRSLKAAKECLKNIEMKKPIESFHKQRSTYLPCVVASILEKNSRTKILDFGGGFGIGYMVLKESIGSKIEDIDYSIIEVPNVCEIASKIHQDNIKYITSFSNLDDFDLVHASSSIQYVNDWKGLLEKFTILKPTYILLSDIFAGEIETFVTLQNYYDSLIPHWFLSINELNEVLDNLGYGLVMKSYVSSRRLEVEDFLPMENFPNACRIDQTLHLLFKKN